MRLTGARVFNLAVLVVTGIFFVSAFGFSPKARLLPLLVGGPAFLLSIVQTWEDFRRTPEPERKPLPADAVQRQNTILLWLVILAALVFLAGLTIGVAAFLGAFTRLVGRKGWGLSLALAVGSVIVIYGLFGVLLHYPLYRGLLNLV